MSKIEGWKAIAAECGVSEKTAREWAEKHGLPVRDLLGRKYMRSSAFQAWLAEKDRPHVDTLEASAVSSKAA